MQGTLTAHQALSRNRNINIDRHFPRNKRFSQDQIADMGGTNEILRIADAGGNLVLVDNDGIADDDEIGDTLHQHKDQTFDNCLPDDFTDETDDEDDDEDSEDDSVHSSDEDFIDSEEEWRPHDKSE